MKFFKTRYRVVPDNYAGYEVQIKRWWLPIWMQLYFINTHMPLESAKKMIEAHRAGVIYEE